MVDELAANSHPARVEKLLLEILVELRAIRALAERVDRLERRHGVGMHDGDHAAP